MSDGDALLAAICGSPHEDTPRLVYADWLQENSHAERAEFIRVQCELSRLPKYEDDFAPCKSCDGDGYTDCPPYHRTCRRCDGTGKSDHKTYRRIKTLLKRQQELIHCHANTKGGNGLRYSDPTGVMDAIPGWRLVGWDTNPELQVVYRSNAYTTDQIRCRFARGFVHAIECDGPAWIRHAAGILANHPVRRITLTTTVVPDQDGDHIWYPGYDRIHKWRWLAGGNTTPAALGTYWPQILFKLPDWPHRPHHEMVYSVRCDNPDVEPGDWFLLPDHHYAVAVEGLTGRKKPGEVVAVMRPV